MKYVFFDFNKCIDIVAYIKYKAEDISAEMLQNMIYLLDRESLINDGYIKTYDQYIKIPTGILLPNISFLIKDNTFYTSQVINPKSAEECGELSKNTIKKIDGIFNQYGAYDSKYITDYILALPEIKDKPLYSFISLKDILKQNYSLLANDMEHIENIIDRESFINSLCYKTFQNIK